MVAGDAFAATTPMGGATIAGLMRRIVGRRFVAARFPDGRFATRRVTTQSPN
jgi:hypothetical protein